jgi:hypothetical protein
MPIGFFVPTVLRIACLLRTGTLPSRWEWMTHFCCEGLIAGVWLAYLFVERPLAFEKLRTPSKWVTLTILFVLFGFSLWEPRDLSISIFVYTIRAIGFAACVRTLYDFEWHPEHAAGKFCVQAICGIALCSYSIYLTHTTGFRCFWRLMNNFLRGFVKWAAIPAETLVAGVLFYFIFERTAIVTRDWFEPFGTFSLEKTSNLSSSIEGSRA